MHPYLRLRLILSASEPDGDSSGIDFSEQIAAPILRRVLGRALIEKHCAFGRPLCEPHRGEESRPPGDLCSLAEKCPYGILSAASTSPRPPYALHIPSDEHPAIELTLLGPGWSLYPWALRGIEQALRWGLGKQRRRFEILKVLRERPDRQREELCNGELDNLTQLKPDLLGPGLEPFLAPQPVRVELLSPLRLVRDGKVVGGRRRIPFDVLIARILDRFAGVFGDHASQVLDCDVRSAIETEAARVPLLVDDTHWVDIPDYSARHKAELKLGGKMGRLIYGEGAAGFYPILRVGEVLHLGKNPASGCGRIEVSLSQTEQ